MHALIMKKYMNALVQNFFLKEPQLYRRQEVSNLLDQKYVCESNFMTVDSKQN